MTTTLKLLTFALLAQTACTADEPAPFAMRPLAAIPLDNGGAVEMVEVAPGIIAISETAPIGQEAIVTDELAALDPETLFATLRPADMEAPPELTQAFERRRQLVATGELALESSSEWRTTYAEPALKEDGYGSAEQGLYTVGSTGAGADRAAFIETWCLNTSGNWSFCDVDQYGGHSRTRNDVDRYACTGATFSRTATMYFKYRVWFDWTTFGRWTVNQGFWRRVWTEETGGLDYDAECGMSTKTNCALFDYVCLVSAPKAGFHLAGNGVY